jgi:hypothetical protein
VLKTGSDGERLITDPSLQYVRFKSASRQLSGDIGELVGALVCAPIANAMAEFVAEVAQRSESQVVWSSGRDGLLPFSFFERDNVELFSTYFPISRVAIESPNFDTYLKQMIQ